jgi:hypothetical protein
MTTTTNNSDTEFYCKTESIALSVMIRSLRGNWDNIYECTIDMCERDLARTDDELRAKHFPMPPYITRRFALQTKVCMNLLKAQKDDDKETRKLLATMCENKKLTYDYIKGFCAVSCDLSVLMDRAFDMQETADEGTYLMFCNALKSLNDEGEKFRKAYMKKKDESGV